MPAGPKPAVFAAAFLAVRKQRRRTEQSALRFAGLMTCVKLDVVTAGTSAR